MWDLEGLIATTHVDSQGEQLTKSTLTDLVATIRRGYLPLMLGHDPREPPIGRLLQADLVELPDGEFGVRARGEVWDEHDPPEVLKGDGRLAVVEDDDHPRFIVLHDLSMAHGEMLGFVSELAAIAGAGAEPVYNAKKALDAVTVLVIAIGLVAKGFLSKVGSDAYEHLKGKLKARFAYDATPPLLGEKQERILSLRGVLDAPSGRVVVEVLATNPTTEDIDALFEHGLRSVEGIAASLVAVAEPPRHVVLEWKAGQPRLSFTVDRHGVPAPRRRIGEGELLGKDLSIDGTTSAALDDDNDQVEPDELQLPRTRRRASEGPGGEES